MPGRRDERFETDLEVQFEGGRGVARNVSASGIYFVTDVALREGQPLRLSLVFDDLASGSIAVDCMAHVVRTEEQGAERGVGAAISSFEFRRLPISGESST